MDKIIKRVSIKISGQVQGVLFRAEAKQKAENLGIVGLARNLDDGTVEIIAEGEAEHLKKLLEWCRQGPELAKVEKVDSIWQEATGRFENFQVKY